MKVYHSLYNCIALAINQLESLDSTTGAEAPPPTSSLNLTLVSDAFLHISATSQPPPFFDIIFYNDQASRNKRRLSTLVTILNQHLDFDFDGSYSLHDTKHLIDIVNKGFSYANLAKCYELELLPSAEDLEFLRDISTSKITKQLPNVRARYGLSTQYVSLLESSSVAGPLTDKPDLRR